MCEVATESFYIGTFGSQIHVITKTLKVKPKLHICGYLLALVILVFQFNLSIGSPKRLAHNDVTKYDGTNCVFKWYLTCEVKTV